LANKAKAALLEHSTWSKMMIRVDEIYDNLLEGDQ
jgi:hypothetical protein